MNSESLEGVVHWLRDSKLREYEIGQSVSRAISQRNLGLLNQRMWLDVVRDGDTGRNVPDCVISFLREIGTEKYRKEAPTFEALCRAFEEAESEEK